MDVDGLSREATAVLRAAGAAFAYVHGSRASGAPRPDSDLDVAAHWGTSAPASYEVDVPAGVDLMVLDTAPLEARGRVAAKGTLLFEDDRASRVHWEAMTRKIWFDERPRIERAHREFAAALARGVTPAVDPARVLRLLRTLTDEVALLERENFSSVRRRADPMWLRGVKFSFVVVVEAAVDTAQHMCTASGWGPPADNGHAMRLLGEHGVLDSDLAARMTMAVRFRNVLVHDYARVDDDLVVRRLGDLSDLTGFARAVSTAVSEEQR